MFEYLTHEGRVERRIGRRDILDVGVDERHSLLNRCLLGSETLVGGFDGEGLAIDTAHGLALTSEQDRGDPLTAADIQDALTLGMATEPMDASTRAGLTLRRPPGPVVELSDPVLIHELGFLTICVDVGGRW